MVELVKHANGSEKTDRQKQSILYNSYALGQNVIGSCLVDRSWLAGIVDSRLGADLLLGVCGVVIRTEY